MKIFVVFDAYASSYDVSDAAAGLKSISGVNSVTTMEKVAGEVPRYCIEVDIEDENAEATGAKLREAFGEYSSYMTNVAWGAYKKV